MSILLKCKACRVCRIVQPLKNFYLHKQCRDGVVGTCRTCSAETKRKWYAANRKRRQEVANKRNRSVKRQVVEFFKGTCHDCNKSFPDYVFEFHHLDPSKKDMNPSSAMTHVPEKMWPEIKKCIMLCVNCHKIRHWGGRRQEDEGAN